MSAIFIAGGPVAKGINGRVLSPFPNVNAYNLIAKILDVSPRPNNGSVDFLENFNFN